MSVVILTRERAQSLTVFAPQSYFPLPHVWTTYVPFSYKKSGKFMKLDSIESVKPLEFFFKF